MKKLVSIILIVLLLALSLSSCDLFIDDIHRNTHVPDWYIGGYGKDNGLDMIYFWVETYEEMEEAVQLLESNGSTFGRKTILNYEGDLFDVKYCFAMNTFKTKRVPWGENQFDRKAENVTIDSVIFFDDISVEWIENNYLVRCDCYHLTSGFSTDDVADPDYKTLPREWDVEEIKVNITVQRPSAEVTYDLRYSKECVVTMEENKILSIHQKFSTTDDVISDECIDAILDSIVKIEI